MIARTRKLAGIVAFSLVAACAAMVVAQQAGLAQTSVTIDLQTTRHAGSFNVPLDKSQILRLDVPFVDLSIGNPGVADVLAMTNRTIYVLGKSIGSTNLSIFGDNKSLIAVIDIVVSFDIAGLKSSLFEHLPNQKISVRTAAGSVVLSGTVSSASHLSRALSIAERFAPDQVTNLMKVAGSQQVLLEVRFAEIQRSAVKELGFNTDVFKGGPNSFKLLTGQGIGAASFLAATLGFTGGGWTVTTFFDALEEVNLVKTLAEPNLVAMSGDTASFLAGGEFPIPVAQSSDSGGSTITIEFKQFGVGLSFTPTVLDNGLINLVVNPEVSAIDPTTSVQVGSISVPGLIVRRATTTVELRDGESFAIAGLLQDDFQDQVRQVPLLGDVPILGALFRSSNFQHNETELVIIVTPHLVRPVPAGSLLAPTDTFIPPSDFDLFLLGRTEAPGSGAGKPGAGMLLGSQSAGGISGQYGHIIE